MPTLVYMVLAIAVLLVPLGSAYVIVQGLARRRQRSVSSTGTRNECAACGGETSGKIRDFFNNDGRTI